MESTRTAPAAAADAKLPLLGPDAGLPFAWRGSEPIGRQRFLADVKELADRLPAGRYVINTCDDRYRFLVTYGAALTLGQTSLLPHNRTAHAIQQITRDYAGAHVIGDPDVAIGNGSLAPSEVALPAIPRDHIAAIVFTSGSTGEPTPHWKRWGSLVEGAELVQTRYGVTPRPRTALVATVAPQHMFGLEASIMLPMVSGVTVHAGRPLFPADLLSALAAVAEHRILVTTPYHLGVLLQAGLNWPPVELIISATAPMSQDLAARAEDVFGARVMEIFGSTESGAIASRRTMSEPLWTLYDGLRLTNMASLHYVEGGHLAQRVALRDRIELRSADTFALLGRDEDLVKVGGKRCSLGDLNRTLSEIPGVVDGVFVLPESRNGVVTRLAAFVVAPGQSLQVIQKSLSQSIDPAFLPRPLHMVESLPRNETGKLVRKDLLALLELLGGSA